jgi:hypothetical protein
MAVGQGLVHVPVAAHLTARWCTLVAEQDGVVSSAQLAEFGVTRSAITAQVDAGRWRRVLHRVYATFTGPLPRDSMLRAALLYAGPSAALSYRTAAEQWRMCLRADGPVHVTVPYGSSAVSREGLVVVHRSRAFRHIVVPAAFPVTGRADTVIDLAVAEASPREAMRTITGLLTSGAASPGQVARRLVERRPSRHGRALADAVHRVAEGVQSVLEECYAVDVEHAHALPRARRQMPVIVDGRTLFEDAAYDHLGVPLTVRLDGRSHLRPDVAHRDRRRDNAAELAGRSRLVFGWTEVSGDPCAVAGEVVAVLRRHGWSGPLHPCPRCASHP